MLISFSVFRAFFCLTCYSLVFSQAPVRNCFSWYFGLLWWMWYILLPHRSVSKGLQWLPWTLWRPSAGFGCDWSNSRPRFYATSFIQGKCFYIVRYHCSLQLTTVRSIFHLSWWYPWKQRFNLYSDLDRFWMLNQFKSGIKLFKGR